MNERLNVVVLGSGAREHALAMRLGDDATVGVTPGGECIPGSFTSADASLEDLVSTLQARAVDLVVVGPEALLARGIAGRLRRAGVAVFGPDEDEARLETSKAFAKDFMTRHRVARAKSETVRGVSVARKMGLAALAHDAVVVKYDGLAAGKGVFVCTTAAELEAALVQVEASWGSGAELVLEERLIGRELSLVALVAGGQARMFPPVEDHKQLHDGDRGPMTGGMGAYYPVPYDSPELRRELLRAIVEPTLAGLRAEFPDYRGAVFFGVMVTAAGPKLLEYNVRFGDPETQVLVTGMDESLTRLCHDVALGKVEPGWIQMRHGASVCVVLAAPGYPERPELGLPFAAPIADDVTVFYAGARCRSAAGDLVTAGGRVLSVVANAESLEQARAAAYRAIEPVVGLHCRRDIGARL